MTAMRCPAKKKMYLPLFPSEVQCSYRSDHKAKHRFKSTVGKLKISVSWPRKP